MRKEAEKIYHGITHIDDALLIEFDDSVTNQSKANKHSLPKAYFLSFRKKKLKIITLASALIVILIAAHFMYSDNMPITTNNGSDTKMGGNTEIRIGVRDGGRLLSLNAEEIADTPIDTSQLKELNSLLQQVDYEQILDDIERIIDGTEGFLLADTHNLGISRQNMYMIDVNHASVANIAYEFIFSDDEVVGYVMFFVVDGKLDYSISLNTSHTRGYFFDFLVANPDLSFVVLTDGYSNYFLSEKNLIYRALSGSVVDDFPITGDCYQALHVNGIDISFHKIMEQIVIIQEQ